MTRVIHRTVFLIFCLFLFTCGCSTEPPLQPPDVTVTDIALADVSLRSMTVNTTILVSNPNPVGANLNRIVFDVYYLDGSPRYLGHGERHEVDIKEKDNTSITIPVVIDNLQALRAIGTLAEKGSITIRVNGSAFIDVAVTEYAVPFEKSRSFDAREFDLYLPVSALASINITEKAGQVRDFISSL
jgi:LEA14-like dessication related protein